RNVGQCTVYGTPLVIDFDGDGLDLSGPEEGVMFDLLATGTTQRTGWVKKPRSDMFLVHDIDGNGVIEGDAELFGNRTRLPDGTTSDIGFDALSKYDANSDGVIDAKDSIFAELSLWSDRNGDGRTQPGELLSLESMRVVSVRLSYTESDKVDSFGN